MLLKHLIWSLGCHLIYSGDGSSSKVFVIFQMIVTFYGKMQDGVMGKKQASFVKRLSDLWSVQCRKKYVQEPRFFFGGIKKTLRTKIFVLEDEVVPELDDSDSVTKDSLVF